MSAHNLSASNWIKAQGSNIKASGQITFNQGALHEIIVNSHTTGTWRLCNGTATSNTAIGGTYTPASGSSTVDYKELEFTSGIYIQTAGTVDLTAVFNDLV